MIECSVFGYLKEIDCICSHLRLYKRTEKIVNESIYSNGPNTLLVSEENDGVYLISRSAPDRNKNRISLCSKVQRSRVRTLNTLKTFLSSLGFELERQGRVELITFEKGSSHIEISRHVSGEGSNHRETGDDYYLVKAFIVSGNAHDGERMLSRMIEELEGQVQLVKPSIK
ncbi:hypothetical protein EHEL_070690 [Encephalitozoon hellem ATCC 50504]|uniref:Mediator of RNA polymerase II transcription subunit 18 n=1 Tax=Encephalitozoon hellem TaxID=27973 RepID=A0A9Q9FBS9_ENCHE|nr:uncharacterized protein EHEL_070690 [Encephalitozoon hellem ATCC 50504]AFM98596.1 hypothetical protein EHEL_070690 [Encephalitozoon hellem ATCC 50504]UTX43540.1 mediator of RNA polymerase II transcription subunit 18 [Encephalitozoon hellem]WEL39014.1 mediator of RNA polymerase II transcription subunit 18 [Encephalitozoon hellem]|eukprot:XP_003887577.1 hypothetical protein EHEL_070690 [Encephalitozoon hellem ATCC 50504]